MSERLIAPVMPWVRTSRADARAAALADRHYSRKGATHWLPRALFGSVDRHPMFDRAFYARVHPQTTAALGVKGRLLG